MKKVMVVLAVLVLLVALAASLPPGCTPEDFDKVDSVLKEIEIIEDALQNQESQDFDGTFESPLPAP